MNEESAPAPELEQLRRNQAALEREIERLRAELAATRRTATRRDEAHAAETLGQAGQLAASEARTTAAEVDAREAWARAAELGSALGRRIAEGQARLIASQAAVASLKRANEDLTAGRAAIALREADLRAVIESAIDCAIVTTDRDGLVLAWNSGARHLLGWDEASAVMMHVAALLPPEDLDRGAPAAEIAAVMAGSRVSREGWLQRQDGGRVWAGIEAMALRADGAEEPVGVLWMLRDRSTAQRMEAALRENEARLRGILDGMTEGFGLLAPDFTILEHNLEALRLDGRPREQIVGRSHWEAFPGSEDSELGRLLKRAMAERVPVSLEHRYAFENGRARWLDMQAYPTADGALAVFWRDVTGRRTAEEALRNSERQFRALADTAPALIWQNDALGANVFVNRHFTEYTGLRAEEISGERWHALVHPEQAAAYIAGYLAAVRDRSAWRDRTRLRRHDGAWRWFDNIAEPLFAADGRYLGHVGVSTDITVIVEAEAALRESERRQAFVLRLSDALRPLIDPVETQRVAMRLLGEFLGVERAFYYRAEWTAEGWAHVVDHDFSWRPGLPVRIGRRAVSDFGEAPFAGLARGEPVTVADVSTLDSLDAAQRARFDAMRLRSFVVVPIMKEGRYVAGVSAWSADRREWTEGEIALVTEVAERTWAAAERARAEAALHESEARFRGFAENSADVLWILNDDATQLDYLSPAFERVFGEKRDRMMADLGRFLELVHPEDRAGVAHFLPRALGGETAIAHYRVVRPADGRIVHLRDTGFPIRDAEGAVARVAGVVQDVTDLHDAAAAREAEKERFRSLAEGIPQLVWRADPAGAWTWASPQWTAYTGQDSAASAGEGWLAALHPGDRERATTAWQVAAAHGVYEAEFRLRHLGRGRDTWFQVRGMPVRDAAGALVEWIGACTNIDEEVRAREVLAQSAEELERRVEERTAELMAAEATLRQSQKMDAIGQLTGGIAHDFNNMLQGVIGALAMAGRRLSEGRTVEVARYMQAAGDAAARAAGLTRRLLAFARRQRLDPHPLDPDALVRGMSDLLRRTMGPAIEVEFRLRDGAGHVLCDASELEGAVLNLCINARDAMPTGGRLILATDDLHLSAADIGPQEGVTPGDFVSIRIEDTGTGMAPEVLERVLEPFFTTKPIGQGTGLGLSQVHGFVRQSGGTLRIASTPGRGTAMQILLPRSAVAGEPGPDAAAASEIGPADVGATVLIIDDETAVRAPAAERLRDLGYTVVEANDGPTALRLLDEGLRPDILVTDVGLPNGMDGRVVTEEARRRLPDLPVVFVTGYARVALPEDAVVVTKPFDLDMLARRLEGTRRGGRVRGG